MELDNFLSKINLNQSEFLAFGPKISKLKLDSNQLIIGLVNLQKNLAV